MFCSNCGKNISDDSKFCRFCGSPVEAVEIADSFAEADIDAKEDFIHEEKTVEKTGNFDEFQWNIQGYPAEGVEKTEDVDFNWNANPSDIRDRFTSDFSAKKTEEITGAAKKEFELSAEDIFPKKIKPEPVSAPDAGSEQMSAADKIEKFYTFNKKKEEFQALLDKEYKKIQSGNTIGSELSEADSVADEKFRIKKEEPTMEEFLSAEGVNRPYEPKAFESDVLKRIEAQEIERERERQEEERIRLEKEKAEREKAEKEAQAKAAEEMRLKEIEEARIRAEEEARLRAEAEAEERRREEEEARFRAEIEAEAKRKEEEARLRAEAAAEANRKAEEEARIRAEEEEKLRRIQEAQERERQEEEKRLKLEAELKAAQEAAALRARKEEELARQEEARFREEESRRLAEEQARQQESKENILAREMRVRLEQTAKLKAEEAERIKEAVAAFRNAEEPAPRTEFDSERIKAHEETKANINDMAVARDSFFAEFDMNEKEAAKSDDIAKTRVIDKKDIVPDIDMTRRISKEELKYQEDRDFFANLQAKAEAQEEQDSLPADSDDFLSQFGDELVPVQEEPGFEGLAPKEEPEVMPESGSEEAVKPGLDNTMVMPEADQSQEYANDFDSFGEEEAEEFKKMQGQEASLEGEEAENEIDEESGEPRSKSRIVLKVILIVLIVIFAVELAGIGIKWVAPESAPAQFIDKGLNKVIHLITGDYDTDTRYIV